MFNNLYICENIIMGGSISFIKRLDRKVTCVDGYTNSLSSQISNIDFFKTSNFIDEYLDSCEKYENFQPDGYGIFIVDYDTKSIYTINGYSSYIDVLPISYEMYERGMYGSRVNPYREWFDEGLLYINKKISYEGKDEVESLRLDRGFDTLKDMCLYVNNNQYEKIGETTSFMRIFFDLEKIGWKSYNFEESFNGYFRLYNQLIKDGFDITTEDLDIWDKFFVDFDEEDENNYNFKSMVIQNNREKELNKLI